MKDTFNLPLTPTLALTLDLTLALTLTEQNSGAGAVAGRHEVEVCFAVVRLVGLVNVRVCADENRRA